MGNKIVIEEEDYDQNLVCYGNTLKMQVQVRKEEKKAEIMQSISTLEREGLTVSEVMEIRRMRSTDMGLVRCELLNTLKKAFLKEQHLSILSVDENHTQIFLEMQVLNLPL
jgi:hypothetical protein